jgi:NTE family protein
LGTFRKLKELGLLDKIDVISSNSGGSITAEAYSLDHKYFEKFESVIREGVKKEIVLRILIHPIILLSFTILVALFTMSIWMPVELPAFVFTAITILTIAAIFFFQFRIFPISKIIENKYDKIFFKKKKLSALSSSFNTTINSTNIATGKLFYFSKEKMTDSTYSHPITGDPITFKPENFPVARAATRAVFSVRRTTLLTPWCYSSEW